MCRATGVLESIRFQYPFEVGTLFEQTTFYFKRECRRSEINDERRNIILISQNMSKVVFFFNIPIIPRRFPQCPQSQPRHESILPQF